MLLYIIRHGDPNYKNDCLTARGRLQAEAVGKRMVDAGINRIFTSPYGRARETADPACRMLGIPYTVEEWAHEIEDERLTRYTFDRPRSITLLPPHRFRENGTGCQQHRQGHQQAKQFFHGVPPFLVRSFCSCHLLWLT